MGRAGEEYGGLQEEAKPGHPAWAWDARSMGFPCNHGRKWRA